MKTCFHILFILTFLCSGGYSQEVRIDDWVKGLSVKKDICAVEFEKIYNELSGLDSLQRCNALRLLEDRSKQQNTRYQIRIRMLRAEMGMKQKICPDTTSIFASLENALHRSYEIEDHILAAQLNQLLGEAYRSTTEINLATMYKLIARDMRKEEGEDNFPSVAMDLYILGDLLYKLGDYHEALIVDKESVKYRGRKEVNKMDSLSLYWKMNAWNNIGLCYNRLDEYDSAFVAFNLAYELANAQSNVPFWKGLIQGNRGDVFFLQGKYDSAEVLLKLDYEQSLVSHEYDNASMTLQRLARIQNSRGEHQLALKMVKEADQLWHRMPKVDYRASILYAYALVYRDLNNADSAFKYMEEYKENTIASEKVVAQNRMEIVRLMQDNQKNVHRVQALNKEKNRIKLIRNFTIVLTLLITAFGLLYLNRARLKLKLRQQEAYERERIAKAEAQSSKEQLNIFTQRMLEKNALVETLQEQLLKKELNETQIQYITELSNHTILTDKDWEEFKGLFEKVYPGFFITLKNKAPDITLAEQRIAALSKLRVESKEAATLLGVSPNTISKSRQRLRQRLGLDPDTDLEAFFSRSGA